ncbi:MULTISPECIES: thioredoxin family protein [Burkholderia]|uniref:thioredoxin family protein n=1 Tax=Burkholderia TaxID=32008 RepID=UPI000841AAFB|nr:MULTISPECIES: thioredoxin family protein [unclassified Burkholderia]AOK31445.1 thioredoxin [Burkholderia sp. Bp7605]
MFKRIKLVCTAAWVGAAAALSPIPFAQGRIGNTGAAPEFAGIDQWINSKALTMQQLRGQVVLVDFWTYGCVNCIHTVPYIERWHERYKDQGLVVVGVHTPEYPFEQETDNVKKAIVRFGISFPVAQDNRYATWNAYGNQYWPALYLIDRRGHIVYSHFGEGAYAQTEAAIQRALADKG